MKRREFLSSAGAAAVLPVLPLPAMATPTAIASANATQVGWAALFARAHNHASVDMIQKWMGVGPDQAQALMSELMSRNIIHAPIAGTSAAVQPMYSSSAIPGAARTTGQFVRKAMDVFDKFAEPDDDQPKEAALAEINDDD